MFYQQVAHQGSPHLRIEDFFVGLVLLGMTRKAFRKHRSQPFFFRDGKTGWSWEFDFYPFEVGLGS